MSTRMITQKLVPINWKCLSVCLKLGWWCCVFFSLLPRIWGKVIHSLPVLFFFFFSVSFKKRRSACAHHFHFLCQDQSTVAQRAKTTVAECSLMSCMWTHFPSQVPTLCPDSTVSPFYVGLRMYACLSVTCHVNFRQNDQAATQGETDTEWESAQKVSSGEENSLWPRLKLTTFHLQIWRSAKKQSQLSNNGHKRCCCLCISQAHSSYLNQKRFEKKCLTILTLHLTSTLGSNC